MTPDLLRSRILLLLGLPLAGCPTASDTRCLSVAEDAACPSAEEAADELVGESACSDRVVSVDGEATRGDGWDTATESCCYPVTTVDDTPGSDCMEGRPLTVAGRAILARATAGGGWARGPVPAVDGLDAATRAALAAAWTDAALAEHASVAAFARVTLELLAAGAPAELVAAAQGAARDEVRHARLCFALASAYAGRAVAPGPLPMPASVPVTADLAGIAAATVREGCVGETLSALLAGEALAGATDPAVRSVLAAIARDEARHAELAWRTVRWAVAAGGAPARAAARAAFADALARPPRVGGVDGGAAHGRLDAETAARVAAAGLREVIAPCAAALLDEPGAARATG